MYIGTVNAWGKPDGVGRLVIASNYVHEGAFFNGCASGYGRCLEPCGNYFQGEYRLNERDGRGKLTYKDGHQLYGIWKNRGYQQDDMPIKKEKAPM